MKAYFARKPYDLEEIEKEEKAIREIYNREAQTENYKVIRELTLSDQEFETLKSNFFRDIWEPGQGGHTQDGERKVIRCKNINADYNLLIDPQGFNYSRYVAKEME